MVTHGNRVPHFDVTDIDGHRAPYATIWQARRLVLLTLPAEPSAEADAYAADLRARIAAFDPATAFVATRDDVPGIHAPGVVVADEWGEIVHAATAPTIAGLPGPQDVLDWIAFTRIKCPECEGEAK